MEIKILNEFELKAVCSLIKENGLGSVINLKDGEGRIVAKIDFQTLENSHYDCCSNSLEYCGIRIFCTGLSFYLRD